MTSPITIKSVVVAVLLGVFPALLLGTECGTLASEAGYPIENSTTLRLVNEAPTIFSNAQLQNAVSKWSGCSGFGTDFPTLQVGGSGGKPIFIEFVPSSNPEAGGKCESVDISISGHTLNYESEHTWQSGEPGLGRGGHCDPMMPDSARPVGHTRFRPQS